MTPERARRLLPLGAAAAGVVLAHAADYALVYPDPAQRSRELGAAAIVVAALRGT